MKEKLLPIGTRIWMKETKVFGDVITCEHESVIVGYEKTSQVWKVGKNFKVGKRNCYITKIEKGAKTPTWRTNLNPGPYIGDIERIAQSEMERLIKVGNISILKEKLSYQLQSVTGRIQSKIPNFVGLHRLEEETNCNCPMCQRGA